MIPNKKILRHLLNYSIFLSLAFSNAPAFAQMGQNLTLGNAKALGLGNSVTADPPGIDAIHFNPAGLTRLKGRQFELKTILGDVAIDAEFTPSPDYTEQLANQGFTDPVSNSKSEIEGISIYLPGAGFIDMPFIVAPPFGGVSFAPENSRFTFANAGYAPLIVGLERSSDDPGRFSYEQVGASRITYLSPSVGFQATPTLSVGLSLGISYFGVGANVDLRFPNALLGGVESLRQSVCNAININEILCQGSLDPTSPLARAEVEIEDRFSTTYNLGLLWEPNDWFTWGMVYQSNAKDTLEGTIDITYANGVQDLLGGIIGAANPALLALVGLSDFEFRAQTVDASVELEFPQHFATGISVKVLPDWKVNFDIKWTDSGVWDEWTVELEESVDVLSLLGIALPIIGENNVSGNSITIPRGYQSVWDWSIGIEHQFSNRLALRAGYEPRKSQIPSDRLGLIVPVEDIDVYSLGFGFQWKPETEINGALSYINSSYDIPANSSTNFNDENIGQIVYKPYVGQSAEVDVNVFLFLLSYRTHW